MLKKVKKTSVTLVNTEIQKGNPVKFYVFSINFDKQQYCDYVKETFYLICIKLFSLHHIPPKEELRARNLLKRQNLQNVTSDNKKKNDFSGVQIDGATNLWAQIITMRHARKQQQLTLTLRKLVNRDHRRKILTHTQTWNREIRAVLPQNFDESRKPADSSDARVDMTNIEERLKSEHGQRRAFRFFRAGQLA